MSNRKPRSDSIAAKTRGALAHEMGFLPPDSLPELAESEKIAWNEYTRQRNEWKEAELRGLHRLVRLEAKLLELQQEADETPAIYKKANGDFVAHPIHGEVRQLHRLVHSEMRVIGLQTTRDEARTKKGEGVSAVPKAAKLSLLR